MPTANSRRIGWKALGLLVVLATMVSSPSLGREAPPRQLLVLHSYNQGYKWTDEITRGIEAALRGRAQAVKVHYEYMDTKRVADPAYFNLLYETYKYKFAKSPFDAIISSDNDAFNFLLAYRDDLFPGTPVVFCGVNDFEPARLRGARLFTGVNETADLKATLELALKLHPAARRVVVINDTTTTGRIMHKQIDDLIPAFRANVQFVFLEDLAMPQILASVEKLGPDSLVFYTLFSRDGTGRFFEYHEAFSLIAAQCPVPIYGVWDFYLGYGMVGGKLTNGFSQGETTAAMALRILNGEKIENVPIVMQSPNRYMFDYRQLQRFGLAYAPLPEGSIVLDKPAPLFSVAANVAWGALSAITVLVAVILLLLRSMALRKRVAQELRDAALKYRIVADNTYDWEFWIDPDGKFVYSSPSCAFVTGHGPAEFLADPNLLRTIMHPDDRRQFELHAHDVIRNMRPGELQWRIILPDGAVRWIDHLCQPVFDDNGRFLGTRGSNRDITERRQAEEALRNSEQRFRSLLETIPLGVLESDASGVITLTNESFARLTGYRREDILGKRLDEFFAPGPQKTDLSAYLQVILQDQPPPAPLLGKGLTKDGRIIDVQVDWSYTRNDEGEVIGFVSAVSDVTERMALQQMKDEMISAVSHEMRTPLTAMLGFSEFLLENRVDEALLHEYLGIIHKETERLNELINNFLDLQRIKAGQAVYHFRPVPVVPLLAEAAALFATARQKRRITVHPSDGLPPVTGDEGRLHQVLNNLLSNAVKYSPSDGEITLGAKRDGDTVVLWVKDQGIGISSEQLDKIFDKFYRVDSTDRRATGGTGLGLPLVREIVHAHGGRVWVESTPGKGSTFYVSLPVAKEAS